MLISFPYLAAITDLVPGALMTAVAVVISFAAITLVSSYFRFQHIVEQAESAQPEEMGASATDILRIQLARFLSSSARKGTSFCLGLVRIDAPGFSAIRMDEPLIKSLKAATRKTDITCIFDEQTAAVLLMDAEAEDSVAVFERVLGQVKESSPEFASILSVGISSYPGHGLSGKDLMAVAQEALSETTLEHPAFLPEIIDHDAEEEEHEEEDVVEGEAEIFTMPRKKRGKKAGMLDEVTGVLKPTVVSAYMQRQLSEFRRQKIPASLFCIGVNNMEYIARFHGEQESEDVLAGVSDVLQANLRATDVIGRHEKYAFLVLSESTLAQAEVIGKRLSTLVQQSEFTSGSKKLKTTISVAVSAYPEHGRNLHQLYTSAQKVLDYNRTNDIRAYAVYNSEIHDKVPSKPMKSIKSARV